MSDAPSTQDAPQQLANPTVTRADVLTLASCNLEVHRDSSGHPQHKYGNYSIYSPQDIIKIYGL